jgi:hypothetical protein
MNIKFNYLYRDGANYKQNHSEVFSNREEHTIEEIGKAIRSALIDDGWFYADKWGLKDLHLYKWDNTIDHEWHEYDCIEMTEESATVGEISDFIKLIQTK